MASFPRAVVFAIGLLAMTAVPVCAQAPGSGWQMDQRGAEIRALLAIRLSGAACTSTGKVQINGSSAEFGYISATCSEGSSFLIRQTIGSSVMSAVPCAQAKAAYGQECWKTTDRR